MIRFRIIGLTLAALATLAACGGKPAEPGVDVNGERLAVVDMHLHTGAWDWMPPAFQDRLSSRVPRGFKWVTRILSDRWLKGEGIVSQLDSAGVRAGGVFALYSPHTTGLAPNEFVAEQVAVNPERLFGFASIRVDQWNVDSKEQLAMFEDALTNLDNMIGVKLAHAHQQFRFDDSRYYGIYEIAGRLGKPIYLHTATSPNPGVRLEPPYTDPYYLEDAIRRYPDTIFILGHSGWDTYHRKLTYVDACIDLAQRYDNVYMEPGALGADRAAEVLPDFVRRIKDGNVTHKMIYGSDGPQFPGYIGKHLEAYVTAMKDADYTVEEMRNVLADNFSRVFGLPKFQP
jgi:predicted TIM-barrel fold metal-dependent hydrolase